MSKNTRCFVFMLIFCPLIFGQNMEYHAVIAGINTYWPIQNDLTCAVDDANDMKDALKQYEGWLDANITLLTNSQATRDIIYDKLNFINMPHTSGKTNLFYFAGHGSEDGILAYNISFLNFIPPYGLQDYMGYGGFNQYTAILDACGSGVFKCEMNSGVILTACDSAEESSEGIVGGHGTFTYYVLQGLTNNAAAGGDGLLSVEDLYSYSSWRTTAADTEMHPQLGDNYSGDLVLNYNIYVLGQYASLSSALAASHSGQTVIVSSGSQTISSSLTVPSGVTLDIKQSVSLTFTSGGKLTVNGTLKAVGTSSSPITFNFSSPNSSTENGIVFNSGSSGTINYCQIRNAYRGIYENNTTVNITNSAISGCTDGIYLYNSGSHPLIQGCSIHNNSNSGINMLYSPSSTVIKEDSIYNNYDGIYCSSYSQPTIGNSSTPHGNNILNNDAGIICFNSANPMIGNSSTAGYNNLVNSTYNVLNTTGNTIYAYHNWWGTTNPVYFKNGGALYTDYLSTPLTDIPHPPLSKTSGNIAETSEDIPMLSELDKAYQLVESKNLAEARKVCLNLVNNYPDYSVSYNALNLLKETYAENEITAKKDIYKSLFNKKGKKDLYALAGLLLSDIDKENKLKQIDEVITNYNGEKIVELALFDKLVYYNFELNDVKSARAISDELDKQFPKSMGAIEAHKILGDEKYFGIHPEYQALNKTTASTTPKVYTLYDNYPNPFNPTTTINFQLPKDGYVTLKIFDVVGREVASLINEDKKAGYYSYNFDASKLSSGVYIYKITANDFVQSKKMLLMK